MINRVIGFSAQNRLPAPARLAALEPIPDLSDTQVIVVFPIECQVMCQAPGTAPAAAPQKPGADGHAGQKHD
jgi:hypothetical protein